MRLDRVSFARRLEGYSDAISLPSQPILEGRLLRMVGKDTFVPSNDVVAALKAQEIIDKAPTSQRDLATVQAAFNRWQEQSGRSLCQLSAMLAFTVNH